MTSPQIRRLTYAALYLAIALVLPSVMGHIPQIGSMLCPMHIPALLCGFMCGWPWGLAVGFIAPLLSSVITGGMMPPMFPTALAMAFELAAYGGVSGLLYRVLPKKTWAIYAALLISMVAGRIVWGGIHWILAGLADSSFPWEAFLAGAVTDALPGIILHLLLIPVLVLAREKAGLSLNNRRPGA